MLETTCPCGESARDTSTWPSSPVPAETHSPILCRTRSSYLLTSWLMIRFWRRRCLTAYSWIRLPSLRSRWRISITDGASHWTCSKEIMAWQACSLRPPPVLTMKLDTPLLPRWKAHDTLSSQLFSIPKSLLNRARQVSIMIKVWPIIVISPRNWWRRRESAESVASVHPQVLCKCHSQSTLKEVWLTR